MKSTTNSAFSRITALLLTLVCVLGMFPATAFAAETDTIKLERFGMSGVSYNSAALGQCTLHQMYYDVAGTNTIGFCGEKGKGMGNSLLGQTWGNPHEITDSTVKQMMAYYYAHSTGKFTDKAIALGVDTIWDTGYTWYMNAWVQAIVWRYKGGSMSNSVVSCAEELMAVYNVLQGTSYTDIDDKLDGTSFRDRTQYILDLGAQGVWGDCTVKEYGFTGSGSSTHPASTVQSVMIGELNVTEEQYSLTIRKVDATNPTKGLPGARFHIESTNGSFSKDVVTGADGTVVVSPLDANTYAITETYAPNGYQIDNAGPEYVVLPGNGNNSVTVTFTDTPIVSASGSIRKVDADDPTRGLAGAVIKIEGVDNNFSGTYTTVNNGALSGVPWDSMPVGSYTATEVTPPEGYSISSDPNKAKQEFYWDGKNNVALVFENDAKVKVKLLKLDDAGKPLAGAVFNVVKDGQIIASEKTDASGTITITNVTEGMYAFVEVSAPAGYARLQKPVIAHVDQDMVNGGGTVTVTAKDQKLPNLTIQKLDKQTKQPIPGTVFEIKGIHYGYHQDVTTGPDGKAVLTAIPVDSYEVKETSVPDPYVVGGEMTQTIYLGPGDDQNLVFENLKMPRLTVTKIDAEDSKPIPGTVFTVEGIDSDFSADWTTGADGTVTDRVAPGSYKITEKSVPAPYYLPSKNADREQTVSLNAGDEVNVTFKNRKMPQLTIYKEDSVAGAPIEGAKFHITYTSSGESAEAPGTIDYGNILTDAKGEIRLHEQGKRLYPGAYTVTEVEPAPGFQMKEPSTQKIILHGSESKTLTFQNTPLNAIVVEKYDSVTHEALPGCTFQLRFLGGTSGTGGTTIGQKVTGKNGTAIWTGLTAGTYIAEEVDPADGYSIINASETIYLADSGEQSVITVRFDNAPDGILLLRKVCSVNPSVTLANAEFKITYADGTLIGDANGIFRTDEHGEIRVPGLKPGKSVIVTETKAPDGYIIDTQSQTVQIKEGRTVSLTFKNQPKGKLIIQKRDSATGQPLPGAEFRVTTAAGCEVGLDGVIGDSTLTQNGIFTTDANGEIRIINLAPGAYVLTEIKAPTGYVMDAPSTNVVIGSKGDTQTVVIKNSKAGTLIIDKRDSLTGKPLEGVTFKVTTSTGEYVADENGYISSNGLYYTDKDGKITINGVVGTLVVTETKTIPGYSIDPADQTQTVKVDPNETQTLRFTNTPSTTLVIEKYIEGTTTPLKGVTFLVTDSNGGAVGKSNGEFITDENGRIVITDLKPGLTVTAREVKGLEGYVLDTSPKSILIKEGEVQTLRFYNEKCGTLVIQKKDSVTGKPLAGVEFQLTYADGSYVDNANGHLSSKGLYITDANGEIRITGIVGTIVVKETRPLDGYTIAPGYESQTVEVNPDDTQTLTFYNAPDGNVELIKVNEDDKSERIPNTTFEIRRMDDGLVDTVTTDKNGRVRIQLDAGDYYAVEIEAADGFRLDDTPHYFTVENGKNTTLTIMNKAFSRIIIHKIDSRTEEGIYGTKFLLYDANKNPLGEYTSDNEGYVYIEIPDGLSGRMYLRELEAAEGYILDKEYKTVYVKPGKTAEIEWENTAVTGQIQVYKYSAEYNEITGTAPGTPLKGAVYEIINARSGKVVDYITTDARGVAASKPLPLTRYQIREVSAPAYWQVSSEVFDVTLEYAGQIIKFSAYDKTAELGVSITKRGNTAVLAGNQMRYDITVANTSNVDLESFFWHDRIPTDVARATTLTTGTYSARLNYRILYKTNYTANYQVLASNLLTSNNYSFALNAIPVQAGEFITDVYFDFGKVPVGFQSIANPTLSVMVNGNAVNGYYMTNRADVGGKYQGTWQTANASWVTIIRRYGTTPALPKTGY
ncbi:SpaA isopeptide-forming pilin-related protein [Dysosmobacter sp.]|uniref:SpaA isopeptide-forming pilin-related protein n=1 Tax=Dysosmobacter sp. TaxID=2591382 RepID=UPI0030793AAD